jgi:hypothetical protein
MIQLLANNPLLLVASVLISAEIFVLMVMFLVTICSYAFQTFVLDPYGHYATAKSTAKNTVQLAKEKSGEAKVTFVQAGNTLVKGAASFDYKKVMTKAGTEIYGLAKDAYQNKGSVMPVRYELPTSGMRVISSAEISFTKDAPVLLNDQYKDIVRPPMPAHKPGTKKQTQK